MAKFLNTDGLNEWIPRLVNETEKELVIIVPYIKTSDRMYRFLADANKRGVETTLVYRENKLSAPEKQKLYNFDNLNLMHHPNVHAKCYYNENYLIIGSMNLYEYSERNNREMGILLHRSKITENSWDNSDSDSIFQEAIQEIRTIINGAELEKGSRETLEEKFEIEIIKTLREKAEEKCQILNKFFQHKRFVAEQFGDQWHPVCHNYFDKVNLKMTYRAELNMDMPEERVQEIFNRFRPFYHEYRFMDFKFYWNHPTASIYLYPDSKSKIWEGISEEIKYKYFKKGIDELISFMRQFF